jgi:hypothetical protein
VTEGRRNSSQHPGQPRGPNAPGQDDEAGYRFYALYDEISREDILAHAYAQCRSNKGSETAWPKLLRYPSPGTRAAVSAVGVLNDPYPFQRR